MLQILFFSILELVEFKMKNCYSFFTITFLIVFKIKFVVSENIPSNLVVVDTSPSLAINTQVLYEKKLDVQIELMLFKPIQIIK